MFYGELTAGMPEGVRSAEILRTGQTQKDGRQTQNGAFPCTHTGHPPSSCPPSTGEVEVQGLLGIQDHPWLFQMF